MRPLIASLAVAIAVLAVAMVWLVRSAAPPPRAPSLPGPTEREPAAMQPLPPPIQAAAAVDDAAAPDDAARPKAPPDLARPVEPEAVAPPNLDELTQKIEQTPPAERAPLVLQYLEAIRALPPDEQARATERLNTVLHH
jgi:hypothetical protein